MTDFLLLAFVFLIAGVVSVPIASRLGLGSVLGYLIAGIAISPLLAFLGVDVISIQHFAEFGVVMMLFLVGLELEPKLLWQMRARLLGLGGGQVGLTIALVAVIAMLFGLPWSFALATGMVLALSSTAIVLQTLNEKGLMKSDGGQASFSVLLFQDIAVIPMLALLPLIAMPDLVADYGSISDTLSHADGGAHHGEDAAHHGDDDAHHGAGLSLIAGLNGWQTALVNIVAIAAVVLGGNYLTRPIFGFIATAQLRELFTATALMIVIGIALLMSLVGLSPALGTFLAGVVLANSEYRHELESDIEPFKGLLLGLFFMTVGAAINFALLFEQFALILGLTVGLIALKSAILLGLAVIFKVRGADKWLFGLGLAQAGEFGFVLLSFTTANQILPQALADQLLLVVAMSMLLTPALFIAYDKLLAPKYAHEEEREADEIDEQGQIIIAGAGRVGGVVQRALTAAGYTTTVIDYSSRQISDLRTFGIKTYFGDASRPDMLHAAGIDHAKALIIAIDNEHLITDMVRYVTQNYPHVHVVARARNRHHVYSLWAAGCRDIIRETFDSSMRMVRSTLESSGIARDTAQAMVDAFVAMDRQSMVDVADVFDPTIPAVENADYIARVREYLGPRTDRLAKEMRQIKQNAVKNSNSG